jgi:hypothetical protein
MSFCLINPKRQMVKISQISQKATAQQSEHELLSAKEARKQSLKCKEEIGRSEVQRRRKKIIKFIQKAISRGLTEVSLPKRRVNKDEQSWLSSRGYQVKIVHPPYVPDFKAIISWNLLQF